MPKKRSGGSTSESRSAKKGKSVSVVEKPRSASSPASGSARVMSSPARSPPPRQHQLEEVPRMSVASEDEVMVIEDPADLSSYFRGWPQGFSSRTELVCWALKKGARDYDRLTAVNESLRGTQDELVSKAAEARAEVEAARKRQVEEAARSRREMDELRRELESEKVGHIAALEELSVLRAEAEEVKNQRAELAASQGEVLRAFTERLLLSDEFSALASDLGGLLTEAVAVKALSAVADDYPEVDVSKYGFETKPTSVLLRDYVKSISRRIRRLPVLESLASASSLLTAEAIQSWPVDRNADVDALYAELKDETESDEEEPEMEGGRSGEAGAEAEEVRREERAEAPSSGGAEEELGGGGSAGVELGIEVGDLATQAAPDQTGGVS